jgi:hypothetical protein
MAAMQKLSLMGTPTAPGGGPTTVTITPASVAGPAPAAAVQRAVEAAPVPIQAPPVPEGPRDFSTKPSDEYLAKLVRWIYPLISFHIRSELREQRERAGLLTDSYLRW